MSNTQHPKDKPKINLMDRIKPGGAGLTDEETAVVVHDRDNLANHNLQMVQALNQYGVQVDMGMEAIAFFREFLEKLGIITAEQKLAAEVLWEHNFNQQLKFSLQAVRQQQLAHPNGGLIVPN